VLIGQSSAPGRFSRAVLNSLPGPPQEIVNVDLVAEDRIDLPHWPALEQDCVAILSVCAHLAQPLETADAWLVHDPRSEMEQPQMILRIGYGSPIPAGAPRRPVTEAVESLETGQD
jgi:hypothetical protein